MRKALFAVLLMCLPSIAHAQFANTNITVTQEGEVLVVPSAQAFIDEFWANWSSPNSIALPYVRSIVSDPLNFYGKSTSRVNFMKAQATFTNRWPYRQYWVQPNSEQTDCNNTSNVCKVDGIVNWNDFSPTRNATSAGSANFEFSLKWKVNTDGNISFQIMAESGSVISSEAGGQSNFYTAPPAASGQNKNRLVTDAALQAAGCVSEAGQTIQHEACDSLQEIDLTKAFHTRDKVVFEVIQAIYDPNSADPPPVNFCFVHKYRMQCQNALAGSVPDKAQYFAASDSFFGAFVIHPFTHGDYPVLQATTQVAEGFGCGGNFDFVWAYDPTANDFELIWSRPFDCHNTLQIETAGPLAGDFVAVDNDVTGHWPWPYGVEVYKFLPPDGLKELLYIVGRAGQGGKYASYPRDAINIDMPEILRRLNAAN